MNTHQVTFTNAENHSLSANLELPASGRIKAYAIFAHCFTCNKNLNAIVNISRALSSHNIAVLRFDFTGLGESSGDFEETNFSSNVSDLIAANDYLSTHYRSASILIGHSLGGAAVLSASKHISSLNAVVTIGAPAQPSHVQRLFDKELDDIVTSGEATVQIGPSRFRIKEQLLKDLDNSELDIRAIQKPLLILHSPQDEIVGIENAKIIYEAARHPKSFITLDGADHLMTNKDDSVYAGNMIAAWVSRYLDKSSEETDNIQAEVICRTGDEGFTTQIYAGEHSLIADEPKAYGGKDLGPTPYDLLSASLGTCTSMTLRMYADRKKWPLDEVRIYLDHDKIHQQDCEDCEISSTKIDHISRKIRLYGDLSHEQRSRLVEIADKCPVHKTLHNSVKVSTELIDEE